MKRVNPEQPARPSARVAAALACVALALVASAAARAAAGPPAFKPAAAVTRQTPPAKPNIAGEVEEKKPSVEVDSKPVAPTGRKQPTVRPPRPPAPSYEVNIKTDIPEAEIFLGVGNSAPTQSLGKTDAEGRLMKRLPRGKYSLIASRPGYRIQRQRVEVRSGAPNDVNFSLAMPVVAARKTDEEQKTPEPAPTPAEEVAEPPA
ncbi:MAG TPA: carboxypeptidase-like regulatory domain-containing protein, partial [Pyrinomonadaceae bacterium]